MQIVPVHGSARLADRACEASQDLILNDPASVDVVRSLDGGQQRQAPLASKLIRRRPSMALEEMNSIRSTSANADRNEAGSSRIVIVTEAR